jgi:RimJ/RimL family protein N-acetyltransferase
MNVALRKEKLASVLLPPRASLTGRLVGLRPALPTDQQYIFTLQSTGAGLYASRFRGIASHSPVSADATLEYVIYTRRTARLVGYVGAYEISLRHGHAYVGLILNPELVSSGLGVEAGALFLNHLFRNLPLTKIYFEVTEETLSQFEAARRLGLVEEARLREHLLYDGARHDLILFALYRRDWPNATLPTDEPLPRSLAPSY